MVNIKMLNKIKINFLTLRSDSIMYWVRGYNTTKYIIKQYIYNLHQEKSKKI